MSLLGVLIVLVACGVVLYVVGLIPMDPAILRLIRIVAIICIAWWLLTLTGLLPSLNRVPFPHR